MVEKKTRKKELSICRFEHLLLIFSAIIFIDRVLKTIASNSCLGIFCIKRVANFGAAFGILEGYAWLFIITALIVLALIAVCIKNTKGMIKLSLVLIAAGTISNLIDRLKFGYIIDIFSIANTNAFNLADVSNTVGGAILLIEILKKK